MGCIKTASFGKATLRRLTQIKCNDVHRCNIGMQ